MDIFSNKLTTPMLKTIIFASFITLCWGSQTYSQITKVDSSEMRTLRIDPESSRGAAVSQVFDEVEFIPLETTKESLFGSISQLKITDKYYIIFDYDTKSILIFTKEGKFKTKVDGNKIEKDPTDKENQNFYGFVLKREDDKEFIQIAAGKYLIYFDFEGKLVKKVLTKDGEYGNTLQFKDGTKIKNHHKVKVGTDSTFYDLALVKDNKEVGIYFPYSIDRYKNDQFYSSGESIIDYGVENEMFFINYYEYNLYKITPQKLSLSYRIIFPAGNSLPQDFKTNPEYKNKRQEYFEKNPKIVYAIGNTYQTGNNLFFKLNSWSWTRSDKKAFIYNLKTNALTSISDIEPDSLSSFLPVTDASFHYDFSNNGFHLFDGQHFYTSYSSLAMFAFKEQSADKNPKYSILMSDYFKTANKKSNPVIVKLKPKKD